MANMCCKVKGNAEPLDRPRVYFTCHPEDSGLYQERMLGELFAAHDCAVYYTENMEEQIPEEDRPFELGRNHLFVVPVTFRLLSTPNRAMDEDIPYALREHIPVLPLLMEPGLDQIYARPDRFDKLQYLDCSNHDPTRIAYRDKLKKHLDEVLHSREELEQIRSAFSARIFLSYRKADRKHANELLRLIHSHEELRDVAVWFDEFLPLGESFRDSIDAALSKSNAFLLMVTPKLLEEGNFVSEVEYPTAVRAGLPIIAVEVEPTDQAALREKFVGIPDCLPVHDKEAIWKQVLESVSEPINAARSKWDSKDKLMHIMFHEYWIGRAYLDGVDVEMDHGRGMELLLRAANSGSVVAMEKLVKIYCYGQGISRDYEEAEKWSEKHVERLSSALGKENKAVLYAMSLQGSVYGEAGKYHKAYSIYEELYRRSCDIYGETNIFTIKVLDKLAGAAGEKGDLKQALVYAEKEYRLFRKIRGEEDPALYISMYDLAIIYAWNQEYRKALPLLEQVYTTQCKRLGEEHKLVLESMNGIANCLISLGEYPKAKEILEKMYALQCGITGENNLDAVIYLNNLARGHGMIGDYGKALEMLEKCYSRIKQILGELHPYTMVILCNLAHSYVDTGNARKADMLLRDAYAQFVQKYGEEHPTAAKLRSRMNRVHETLVRNPTKDEKQEIAFQCRQLRQQAEAYRNAGQEDKELEARRKLYDLLCREQGEESSGTLDALHELAAAHREYAQYERALELAEKEYALRFRLRGGDHADTRSAEKLMQAMQKKLGVGQKKPGLLGAVRSIFRKSDPKQN